MILKTDTAPFLEALEIAAHACAGKMPILTCILCEARKDGTVTLTGDSLDSRISVSFDGAEVDEPFSFIAAPRMLKASLRADTATIEFKDNRLAIESGGKSNLVTLPVSEFPKSRKEITVKPVESGQFLSALKMVANCADPASESAYNCVAWDGPNHHLVSLGSGRSSICIHELDLPISGKFCLPVPAAKVIGQCFDTDDSFVMGWDENLLCIKEGNVSAVFSTLDVKMPNHTLLIQHGDVVATVGRESLQRTLEALEAFSDLEGNWATIESSDGHWTASAINTHGNSLVPIEEVEEKTPLESIIVSRQAVFKFLNGLEHDRVSIRQNATSVMITPEGSERVMGVFSLRRKDS